MVLTVKIGTRGLARSRNGEGKKSILRRVAGVSLCYSKKRVLFAGERILEDGPEGLCEEGADALEAG